MSRDLFLLDNLFDNLFWNLPKESGKPPSDIIAFKDELKKFHIQLAIAGYSEEDIKVSFEGRVLKVQGDNTSNEKISPKFKSKFQKIWTVQDTIDLESTEVVFKDGLLDITLQEKENKSLSKILFGKPLLKS
jgi:HSP20 family molecular chaperone IbpA